MLQLESYYLSWNIIDFAAQRLIDVCVENAEEFIKSNVGKEVMYEVGFSHLFVRKTLGEKQILVFDLWGRNKNLLTI